MEPAAIARPPQEGPPPVSLRRLATDTRRRRPGPFGRLAAQDTSFGVTGGKMHVPLERQLRETCKDLIALLCINNDLSYEVMARALPSGILCMRCASFREDDRRRMLLRPDLDLMMEQHLASLPQAPAAAAATTATTPASPSKAVASSSSSNSSVVAPGAKVRDLWFGPPARSPSQTPPGGISGLLLSPARSSRSGARDAAAGAAGPTREAARLSLPPGQNWRSVLEAVTKVGGGLN
jgi:hypothetical protein